MMMVNQVTWGGQPLASPRIGTANSPPVGRGRFGQASREGAVAYGKSLGSAWPEASARNMRKKVS
jgi:hypothetical protein